MLQQLSADVYIVLYVFGDNWLILSTCKDILALLKDANRCNVWSRLERRGVDSTWRSRVPEDRGSSQGVVSYAVFTRLECTRRPSLGSGYSAPMTRSLVLLVHLTHRALMTSHNHSHCAISFRADFPFF